MLLEYVCAFTLRAVKNSEHLKFLCRSSMPHSHLKTLRERQSSFQKKTQFSQGNNVLDLPTSNIDGFLTRDTIFLPFYSMEIFCTMVMFLTLENP
jgi:hypothetical protein